MSSYQLSVAVIKGVISWRLSPLYWKLCVAISEFSWSSLCVKAWYSNADDVTPFEGTVSTNFSRHLTDRRHLADIPRYMMCEEKRAQVWMERNKGKIEMTFIFSPLSKSKVIVFMPCLLIQTRCFCLVLLTWFQQFLSQSEVLCQEG